MVHAEYQLKLLKFFFFDKKFGIDTDDEQRQKENAKRNKVTAQSRKPHFTSFKAKAQMSNLLKSNDSMIFPGMSAEGWKAELVQNDVNNSRVMRSIDKLCTLNVQHRFLWSKV